MLLDQEGFECDPISRVEGDTPLHSAVRYINSLPDSTTNSSIITFTSEFIGMMLDAGSDPRLRNKANLTPYQLTDPKNIKLRQILQDAVDMAQNQGDYIVDDEETPDFDEDELAGSGSDSDFDPEEYKREKERREREKKKGVANGVGRS